MQMRFDGNVLAFIMLAATGCAGGLGIGAGDPSSEPTVRGNPFKDVAFFLNPEYSASVEATATRYPEEAATLRKAQQYPTGVWLDSIKAVANLQGWLDEAKQQQDKSGKPTMTVVVVYNLPDRDCSAESSAGELKTAENGEARYRSEFIDPIAAQFRHHSGQPIAVVLEPDSLGNMATNMALPKCQGARSAYKNGIVYAIKSFHLPNVSIYLDAAHAGWLGWDDNRAKVAKIFKNVVNDAGGPAMIRGFATNVSNYTHLTNRDGAALEPSNPCSNELAYAKLFGETMSMYGFHHHGLLIDTSRNGKGGIRSAWGDWCNIKGAGLGERPRAEPVPGVDAYFWVKPPGESDGTSDASSPRADPSCKSGDSMPGAPEAGAWFQSYFIQLVKNAEPAL